ncbi:MAG: carboxypeptidase regulatory-like domain-containing protein [Chitinophagaceae bacterium]|nr:carboxypeptidase regulatory-like domain-containing protein [Chitinophagaceae bacterium]
MIRQIILIAVLLFVFFNAFAHTPVDPCQKPEEALKGIVTDADNKKPLKDVNIIAILGTKKEKAVLSDANGGYRFVMLKPGTYKLVFEKAGYKKVVKEKVEVKKNTPVYIKVALQGGAPVTERGPSAWHFFDSK